MCHQQVFFHLLSFGVLESRAGSLASPGAVTGASQVVRSGQRRTPLAALLNTYTKKTGVLQPHTGS
jgi:hypothetical protein